MNEFINNVQLRWSDLDPNFHARHSVYYDWGAMCRVDFFNKYGLTSEMMIRNQIGPVLFREECSFRKEVKMEDTIDRKSTRLNSSHGYISYAVFCLKKKKKKK